MNLAPIDPQLGVESQGGRAGLGRGSTWGAVSLIAQLVKNLPAVQRTWVRFLGRKDLLEKG